MEFVWLACTTGATVGVVRSCKLGVWTDVNAGWSGFESEMGKFDIETFLFGLRIELKLETEFDAVDSARSKVDFESEFELVIGSLSVVADLLDGLPILEQMTNGDEVTGCVWSLLSTKSVIGMSWVSCLENLTLFFTIGLFATSSSSSELDSHQTIQKLNALCHIIIFIKQMNITVW